MSTSADLPVFSVLEELKQKLSTANTVILQAPPGAGKSTVLPLELMNEAWLEGKKIIMLEPRRLAVRGVSLRLAEQIREEPGEQIGYRMRFDTCVGKNTRVEVVTEGILTRMLQNDNALENVGMIIFDEFHERNLNADLAFAFTREIQQSIRPDLRLLIMSATINTESISAQLQNAPVITSAGRQFPVEIRYHDPADKNYPWNDVPVLLRKILKDEEGDVLVFLPGKGEILRLQKQLEEAQLNAKICPLYGELKQQEQLDAIFPDKNGRRKIILSTSIAETSLTIEGVRVVVDTGFSRIPKFDPRSGLTKLETVRVTADTSDQRSGRAGRLSAGIAYRLWSSYTQSQLHAQRKPEILEADLAALVLEWKNWGNQDIYSLPWITPPPVAHIQQAEQLLSDLGAIENKRISETGKKMLQFATHPRIAKMLVAGMNALAADLAALLEERDPLTNEHGSDIALRIEALNRWRAKEFVQSDRKALERIDRIAQFWRKAMKIANEKTEVHHADCGGLLFAAFPDRIAKRIDKNGRYRLSGGKTAKLPERDPLGEEEWIVAAALDSGTTEGKIFLAAGFDISDLLKSAKPEEKYFWNEKEKKIEFNKHWLAGDLIVKEEKITKPDEEKIRVVILERIQREGMQVFTPDDSFLQLKARISSLKIWEPEANLPNLSEESLIANSGEWIVPFLSGIRKEEDFKKVNLTELIWNQIEWEQQQYINDRVPGKAEVPSGSAIALTYSPDGKSPVLAVRLQECFGMADTPTVNKGKVKVLMHLLSPAYRPVQITQDLRSFWNNAYHDVRKELKIRYPKHSWPEDPWTAVAVRGAKRRGK